MSTAINMPKCASCGKGGEDLKQCTACKVAKYCNATCQKAHWPQHKKECKEKKRAAELKKNMVNQINRGGVSSTGHALIILDTPQFMQQLMYLTDPLQREERRRVGTSYGTSRTNAEAERLAAEARVLKKAKQYQKAHDLYSQAIELDRFNHEYFYHRGETAWSGGQYEPGIWDSQCGLDLCQPMSAYKYDEVYGLLWCTVSVVVDF